MEEEVGVALFLRHTRAVELTGAGAQLLRAVLPSLETLDNTVRQIRRTAGRRSVTISTWASFASMWLIPRLEDFQSAHPDIDIRIDASDVPVDMETADIDVALRYARPNQVPAGAKRSVWRATLRRWPAPGCSRAASHSSAAKTWCTLVSLKPAIRTAPKTWRADLASLDGQTQLQNPGAQALALFHHAH